MTGLTGDMSHQIFTTLGEVCTIKCCVYFVLCVLARESISPSSVTISAVGNFNQTNGVNPLLADICNFSSLSSIGRNSVYVGCSWRLPSSKWLCRWRWQTHTRLDLTTGDDSAFPFHEGDLLQSRLEVC